MWIRGLLCHAGAALGDLAAVVGGITAKVPGACIGNSDLSGCCEMEAPIDLAQTSMPSLPQAGCRLEPAEDLLDTLMVTLARDVARVPLGAVIRA